MKNLKRTIVKYGKLFVWGILFSYILTNFLLADTINLNRILAVGQVYELREKSLTASNTTWNYDTENEVYTISSNTATKSYGKWKKAVDWKCLYLKLDKLNVEQVDWVFKEYDQNNHFVGQQIITLQNGENWIALNTEIPFQRFSIQILGGEGLQFQINKMALLEEIPQKKKSAVLFSGIFLVVFAVGIFLQKRYGRKRIFENLVAKTDDFLVYCYGLVGNSSVFPNQKGKAKRAKHNIRMVLFLILFVYMLIVYNCNVYLGRAYYRYHCLAAVAVILAIAYISKEDDQITVKNDYKTAYWWYLFWLTVCVSDFIVSKRFKFTGWVMLFVVGFFCWVWRQMRDTDEILWDFLHGIEVLAVAGIVYNMIFRLKYDGLLYNGYMKSASDFGMFSAFLCLVFFVEIYECHRRRTYGKAFIFYECGLVTSVLQVLLSGKEIAVAAAVVFAGITAVMTGKDFIRLSCDDKKRIIRSTILACGAAVVYYLAVKNIPWYLGTMVSYEKEQFETVKEPYVIAILAQSGIEAYQNVRFHSANERILIAKAYLRELNFFGHSATDLTIWNKRYNAQNHILQIMYRYGIFAGIPYIAMFFSTTRQAVENCRKNWKNIQSIDVLCAGALLFWCVAGFFGNLEYPYYQPIWLLVYLVGCGKQMVSS